MVTDSEIVSANDFIKAEIETQFEADVFNFSLPKSILTIIFADHYNDILYYTGQLIGKKSFSGDGYYGVHLLEILEERNMYKLDFVMGYEIIELPLSFEASGLIHEFNMKYNREEKLKILLEI